jgi:hypothetical protein
VEGAHELFGGGELLAEEKNWARWRPTLFIPHGGRRMEGVGLALCPHGGGEGGGRRWLSDGGGGVQRWQGRGRGGGGGRLGTRRAKQGKQKGGPVPWADVGEELGVWATIAAGSGQ